MFPNKYGGKRFNRSATGIEKGLSAKGISDSFRMISLVLQRISLPTR
jgi:hypothetical protein